MQKTLSFVRLAAAGSALALVSAAGLAQVIAERVGDGMVQYHAS